MKLGTIWLTGLVPMLVGALPRWGHGKSWGHGPSGGPGVVMVIVLVLQVMGRI